MLRSRRTKPAKRPSVQQAAAAVVDLADVEEVAACAVAVAEAVVKHASHSTLELGHS